MTDPRRFFLSRGERILMALLSVLALLGVGSYCLVAERDTMEVEVQTPDTSDTSQADSLITTRDYVGPPRAMAWGSGSKFRSRVTLDLNAVDSLTLLRVPGIGPATAGRILELRTRLGGFYTVLQLQEVYGVTEERYLGLRRWFAIQTPPMVYPLDSLRADELPYHPYLLPRHRRAINRLLYRYERVASWHALMKTGAFSRDDSTRLSHYFVESQTTQEATR